MSERVFHIGIKALIENNSGDILMLNEVFPDGNTQWDIPGGRMDHQEEFDDTLRRELQEEIGVNDFNTAELLTTVLSNKTIKAEEDEFGLVLVVFKVKLNNNSQPLAAEQGVKLFWLPKDEARKLLLDKYPREFIRLI